MRTIEDIKADIERKSMYGTQEMIDEVWLEWFRKVAEYIDPNHLEEICNAERENRCVVLPSKYVYELTWDAGKNCDLACPEFGGDCDACHKAERFIYERTCKQEHLALIGKTVFLTREAAENALKGEHHE